MSRSQAPAWERTSSKLCLEYSINIREAELRRQGVPKPELGNQSKVLNAPIGAGGVSPPPSLESRKTSTEVRFRRQFETNLGRIHVTDRSSRRLPGNDEQAESGLFCFDHLEPDRYELEIHLNDGQSSTQDIVFRDDKPHEMTIVCPAPRKKIPVQVALKPLPESLRGGDFKIHVNCWTGDTEVGNSRWNPGQQRSQVITFDPVTGQATHLKFYRGSSQADADLKELPAEDRAVFVQTGSIQYEIEASWSRQHPKLEN